VNLGPPTNRPKTGTNVPKTGTWRPVEGKPYLEINGVGQMRTKNWQPPPIPVPIVIDYTFFDESEFPG
jgi:hypothetical protein